MKTISIYAVTIAFIAVLTLSVVNTAKADPFGYPVDQKEMVGLVAGWTNRNPEREGPATGLPGGRSMLADACGRIALQVIISASAEWS